MKGKHIDPEVDRLYEYLVHKTLTRNVTNTYSVSCFVDGIYHQMVRQAFGWKNKKLYRVINRCAETHKNVKLIPGGVKLVLNYFSS